MSLSKGEILSGALCTGIAGAMLGMGSFLFSRALKRKKRIAELVELYGEDLGRAVFKTISRRETWERSMENDAAMGVLNSESESIEAAVDALRVFIVRTLKSEVRAAQDRAWLDGDRAHLGLPPAFSLVDKIEPLSPTGGVTFTFLEGEMFHLVLKNGQWVCEDSPGINHWLPSGAETGVPIQFNFNKKEG